MQFPRIHLNGTDGQQLLDEYHAAIAAVQSAIMTMERVTVHGRDYYVIARPAGAPDPSCVSMDEHRARLNKMRDVVRDLVSIAANIQAQLNERKPAASIVCDCATLGVPEGFICGKPDCPRVIAVKTNLQEKLS